MERMGKVRAEKEKRKRRGGSFKTKRNAKHKKKKVMACFGRLHVSVRAYAASHI